MDDVKDFVLTLVSDMKKDMPNTYVPPAEGAKSKTEMVLANSIKNIY